MRRAIAGGSILVLGAMAGLTAATSTGAEAVKPAAVTVIIKQVNAEMYGEVRSPKPLKCADNRTVWVWKQVGTRGGGNDEKMFMDTTEKQGTKYVWNTGNTGVEGRFYARVAAKAGCKADSSPTILVKRNPD